MCKTIGIVVSLLLLLTLPVPATTAEQPPAQVMLVGVFHFANPGLDAVKSEVIDVTTAPNQQYLEELTDRIAAFAPTAVLLEFNPERVEHFRDEYRQYLEGSFELQHNEIYQLGFRIAAKAKLDTVHSFDERSVGWIGEPLFEQLGQLPERKARIDSFIEQIGAEMTRRHRSLTLGELLLLHNDPELDRENKSFYLVTNDVGAGEGFEGADAAAGWWHRNFRMYARVQQHAMPGARVVVIGGQGHTAILRDLLAVDPDRRAVDVREYLLKATEAATR